MLCRFQHEGFTGALANRHSFPIRFWTSPHFAGPLTPSGKGYANASQLREMCASEKVAQWIKPIHRIINVFRKVDGSVEKWDCRGAARRSLGGRAFSQAGGQFARTRL